MTARFETAVLNERTARIPWRPWSQAQGEYVEIRDEDENDRTLNRARQPRRRAAGPGRPPPSDGNPWFRQQMLYAVAMPPIGSFEKGLAGPRIGRPWKERHGSYRRGLPCTRTSETLGTR